MNGRLEEASQTKKRIRSGTVFGNKKDKNGNQPIGQQKAWQNPNNETDLFADEKERKNEI